ncbi:MAG TPA: hypothetical protein VLJ39_10300, partial [Tepidisphaeraceae bacterium]|nr:hypothetical protein [Tepidisphaeraceae bacterium]
LNMSPQEDRIGRCCKVGKETIFGLLKALEIFVNQDYDATLRMYDERAAVISRAVARFGVTALPRQFNPQALGNVTPTYSWHIDPAKLKITGHEVMLELAATRPLGIGSMGAGASGMRGRKAETPSPPSPAAPVSTRPPANDTAPRGGRSQRDSQTFGFAVWQLKDGEDRLIADRLIEIFNTAQKA